MDSTAPIYLVWNVIEDSPKCEYTLPRSTRRVPCEPRGSTKTNRVHGTFLPGRAAADLRWYEPTESDHCPEVLTGK